MRSTLSPKGAREGNSRFASSLHQFLPSHKCRNSRFPQASLREGKRQPACWRPKCGRGWKSRKQACGRLEFLHFGTLQQKSHPSPLWGRGWTATRAFTSGGGTGEGVKTPTCLTPCFRYRPSHGHHFFHKQLWRFENHADGVHGPYQSAPPCGRGSASSGKDVEDSRFRPPHPSRPRW